MVIKNVWRDVERFPRELEEGLPRPRVTGDLPPVTLGPRAHSQTRLRHASVLEENVTRDPVCSLQDRSLRHRSLHFLRHIYLSNTMIVDTNFFYNYIH